MLHFNLNQPYICIVVGEQIAMQGCNEDGTATNGSKLQGLNQICVYFKPDVNSILFFSKLTFVVTK
jgi:hypothetical protein